MRSSLMVDDDDSSVKFVALHCIVNAQQVDDDVTSCYFLSRLDDILYLHGSLCQHHHVVPNTNNNRHRSARL